MKHKLPKPTLPLIRTASFAALLLVAACAKDDPEASLPAITQQGLNTGGFLVDGKAFPATGWSSTSLFTIDNGTKPLYGGFNMRLSIPDGRFYVDPNGPYKLELNSERDQRFVSVTLFLRRPRTGEFVLNQNTGLLPSAPDSTIFDHATVEFNSGNGEIFSTSARHSGRVVLLRALAASLSSAGTFEFTAVSNLDPTKTVKVTAGRFDRQQ